MANIKVSEMTEATLFDDSDYAMIVQSNQNKKISKENMLSSVEEHILDTNNEITKLRIALGIENDTYDAEKTYNTSDLVVKNHNIYECKEDNVTGTWDITKWNLIPVIIQKDTEEEEE